MNLKLLITGKIIGLTLELPAILAQAGFDVDLLVTSSLLRKSKFIKNYEEVDDCDQIIKRLGQKNLDKYDLIVVGDDEMLKKILHSGLTLEQKLKLLPVTSAEHFGHLYSKIGLSQALSQKNIATPEFLVAQNFSEATNAAVTIGYPILIKVDSSGGGEGVFECRNFSDLQKIPAQIFALPVLVQKKIDGIELDLSAIYRDGKLIYFSYSKIEKSRKKFGPSKLRTYHQIANFDQQLFLEMEQVGEALGANGFTNITCIESATGQRYFFEVDMRPNAWFGFGKFVGDDPAPRIASWFLHEQKLCYPCLENKKYPRKLPIPYYLRFTPWEIIFNRHKVWYYMPWNEPKLLFELLYCQVFRLVRFHGKINKIKKFLRSLFFVNRIFRSA